MKKLVTNKGFSLVELIIVMAIMAVLIGVLAPTYLKYVETTKRTTDCSTIGAVLDSCEVLAADPDVKWLSGDANKVTIVIGSEVVGEETSYSPTTSEVVKELNILVPPNNVSLDSKWGPFTINAVCDSNGHVQFDLENDSQIVELATYSETLASRLE